MSTRVTFTRIATYWAIRSWRTIWQRTRVLLPLTDSNPQHHQSDVPVGVADDLLSGCVGTRPRSMDRSQHRDSLSLLSRALSIESPDKPTDRSICRRGVADDARCVQRLSLHIDRGWPGGIAVANLAPIQHANTRVLGRSRSGHPLHRATSLT